MLSRRDLVGKIAAGTAVAMAAGVARKGYASIAEETGGNGAGSSTTPAGPEAAVPDTSLVDDGAEGTANAVAPWELLHPLALGSVVANGWHIAGLQGAVDGSCVLTLQNDKGRSHRVHMCRNDGRPQGLVHTKHIDLVVMNGGQGDLPTEEGLAQAVAQLAHVLAANEGGSQQKAVVAALLPQAERVSRFTGSADRRLR